MINILNRKKSIEVGKTEVFLADADFEWNQIEIFKGSLICIFEDRVYVNEMPLTFFTILDRLYGDRLSKFKKSDSFVFPHSEDCSFNILGIDEKITIRNNSLSRWSKSHICSSRPPRRTSLDEIPTFKYNGVDYSIWGFQIDTVTKEVEGGFFKKDGVFFEMTGDNMDDWEVKS